MREMVYKDKSTEEILDTGKYNDYRYVIVSRGFHPCAYVELPEWHKYYGLHYDDIPIECHVGLTYSDNYVSDLVVGNGWWIGWDYGHCCDYSGFMLRDYWQNFDTSHYKKWTTAEIFEEVKKVIEQLKKEENNV